MSEMSPSEVLRTLQRQGVLLRARDGKLLCKDPNGIMTDSLHRAVERYKRELMGLLGGCKECPASGFWDYGTYSGQRLCFAYAFFHGRPGKPLPVSMAREKCPLRGTE
ncbi:hypothetical protein ACFL0Q_01545 [Thermodesulfobacteriota bacterium]